jgi:two-component system cell cycle response regulator
METFMGVRRSASDCAGACAPRASTSLTGSAPWTAWLIGLMAAAVGLDAVSLVFHPLPAAAAELLNQVTQCAVFLGAAVLCIARGRTWRVERAAWWLLALAMTLWSTANLFYFVLLVYGTGDILWLAAYAPAYLALVTLLRKRSGSGAKGVWVDALVGGLGVGGAGAAVAFQGSLASTHSTAEVLTYLAIPVGDIGLLALVVAAMTVVGWKVSGVWHLIAPAFVIFGVADTIYLEKVAAGTWVTGGIGDIGWPLAGLLVGLAAWRGDARLRVENRPAAAVVLPAASGLAALALLVYDHFHNTNLVALTLATAAILGILVRLYLTVQDNLRMLGRSRHEAMTDALTGLGNRRQLAADLAAHFDPAAPVRPLVLTIFDLDGFKQYNDTFGHLAGDELLERLGGRLRDLLADRGTAYRMGGDEFCALWALPDDGYEPVSATDAVAALSEQGDGFAIGCSFGAVLLPAEATDATEALRLADQRMYMCKASGRVSAGRQSADVLESALAERDSDLAVHQRCVADRACATAAQLGASVDQLDVVRRTALLHDVGKVAIPDAILNKPEPLDASEWAFIRQHTIIGERIISAAPALAAVARIVRSTHERFDGGGYPDGLAGEDIPLIARIVAVCDAYDAMITDRAYRPARGTAAAIAELRDCAARQFDPVVVEAFVRALTAETAAAREASRAAIHELALAGPAGDRMR